MLHGHSFIKKPGYRADHEGDDIESEKGERFAKGIVGCNPKANPVAKKKMGEAEG